MAHDVAGLIALFRREMRDPEFPGSDEDPDAPDADSLWSDDDIKDYMDVAQEELCQRIDVLPDSSSFSLSVKAGDEYAEADALITKLRHGYSTTTKRRIVATTVQEMERGYVGNDYGLDTVGSWRDSTGSILFLLTDETFGQYRLVPIPAVAETIQLTVYRLPEIRIADGGPLEVPDQFRRNLLLKMRAEGYRKNDAETRQIKEAERYDGMWEAYLYRAERHIKRGYRGQHTTTYGGI